MTDLAAEYSRGLAYGEFLEAHASGEDRDRWQAVHDRVELIDRWSIV